MTFSANKCIQPWILLNNKLEVTYRTLMECSEFERCEFGLHYVQFFYGGVMVPRTGRKTGRNA